MAQRALEKLDMLKKFEKKSRYEMIDARELGKLQLSPFVKTPLTFEFKLDYELSKDAKKRMLTSPHLFEYGQSAFQSIDSVRRPRSAASLQLTRKKHSDKPAVRPFSAPINLKYKSSDKKGNLQALGNGFMILKLKTAHSTEVQKRPKRDTSKILHQTDASCHDFTAAVSGWDGETTATVEEGDKLNQTTIYEESRNQAAQQLERDSTDRYFSHDDLSPDNTNRRSDSLLNIDLTNEIERMIEKALCAELKEKKPFIPLCIEDEIEKPNAKIIRVDNQREERSSTMKMSESFPIYCHNEGYVQKYVLNRWLTLYGDKAFYDTSKKDEINVHLNPVLQNNFNESLAILGSQKHAPANITTKRKKKPIVPKKKPITASTQVLSLERRHFLPPHSQKERPFVQKLSGSFSNSSRRQPAVVQRNISQTIPKCRKDVFMVYGMNPTTDLHHDISASSLISKIKSQFPGCSEKLVGESCKRSRLMHVDYIPISMPISAHASESELPGHDPILSAAHHPLAQLDSTDMKSIERDQSEAHLHVPDKKCSLDEGRLGGIEFSVSRCNTLVPEGSERPSQPTSKLSPRSFPSESNNSSKPLKAGELASGAEDQEVLVPHSTVISIPTAQYDSSEPHRNSNMQETMGT